MGHLASSNIHMGGVTFIETVTYTYVPECNLSGTLLPTVKVRGAQF